MAKNSRFPGTLHGYEAQRRVYARLDQDQLFDLYFGGELTDVAMAAAHDELNDRGIDDRALAETHQRYLALLSNAELETFAATADLNRVTAAVVSAELEARGIDRSAVRDRSAELRPKPSALANIGSVLTTVSVMSAAAWLFCALFHTTLWSSAADRACQKDGYWYARNKMKHSVVYDPSVVPSRLDCVKWEP